MSRVKTTLIIPDTHIPHENVRALKLTLNVAKYLHSKTCKHNSLDEIVFIGDFADFLSVSKFQKPADKHHLLIREIECVNMWLNRIDKLFPRVNKTFIEGNHEYRLSSYLNSRAPEIFGITDCSQLFDIQKRNYKWIPYGNSQRYQLPNTNLYLRHEPPRTSVMASARICLDHTLVGHIHSLDEFSVGSLSGNVSTVTACGFLGDTSKDVYSYAKQPNWELAFCLVHMTHDGNHFIEKCRIDRNYRTYASGRIFQG